MAGELVVEGSTPEEVAYVEAETGVKATEEAPQEVETKAEPEVEEPVVKAEAAEAEEEEAAPDDEVETEEPTAKPRTKDDTIRQLRADRRQLRGEMKQLHQERSDFIRKAEERLARIEEARKPPPPNRDEDPEAYTAFVEEQNKALQQQSQATSNEIQQAREEQEVIQWTGSQESEVDGFSSMFNHVVKAAVALEMDKGESEDYARKLVFEDGMAKAKHLKATGGNWAKFIEHVARKSGWTDGKSAANGSKEKVVDKTSSDSRDVEDSLKALDGGKSAARSPKGGSSTGELTVEEIIAMDDDEFDKYTSSKAARKLFG